MKNYVTNLFLPPALAAGLGWLPVGRLAAQTLTTLVNFAPSRGAHAPFGALVLSGTTLYGTTQAGGDSFDGTIFAVHTDGTGYAVLHSFAGADGAAPFGGLILSGNTLYGMTSSGGGLNSQRGAVFAVHTDGTGHSVLHSFIESEGTEPYGELVLSDPILYGTAPYDGGSGQGTVFAVHTDGTGLTVLHHFTGGSDGARPYASLILAGNTLYGTAAEGGSLGDGTVFAVHTDGTGFTNLYSFTGGSDGAHPGASLVISSNTLYGTTSVGGDSGHGTVFVVHTDGTGFSSLHIFTGGSDGANLSPSRSSALPAPAPPGDARQRCCPGPVRWPPGGSRRGLRRWLG